MASNPGSSFGVLDPEEPGDYSKIPVYCAVPAPPNASATAAHLALDARATLTCALGLNFPDGSVASEVTCRAGGPLPGTGRLNHQVDLCSGSAKSVLDGVIGSRSRDVCW
eukprot:317292_1